MSEASPAGVRLLGIDIGGSALKGAPVDCTSGRLTEPRCLLPTPQPATPAAIAAAAAEIVRHFNWSGTVGIGLPAAVRNGIVRTASNLDGAWIGTDGRQLFAAAAHGPVTLLNDADAAGLAEMTFGAGRGRTGTILVVTIGTGLGTALFRDGVLVPNTELGHLLLDGAVAEQYASAAVRIREGLSYRDWARRLDRYLRRLQELFWPDLFILGGEISRDHEQFLAYLSVAVETVPAALRNDAGIIGAALAAGAPGR